MSEDDDAALIAEYRRLRAPDEPCLSFGEMQTRDTLLAMFGVNRGRLVGHLYLGSKLASARELVGQTALPRMWDTGKTS